MARRLLRLKVSYKRRLIIAHLWDRHVIILTIMLLLMYEIKLLSTRCPDIIEGS